MLTKQQIIAKLIEKERVVIVQPLGWGKRDIYEQATKQLRAQDEGVTVVISRVPAGPCIDAVTNQTFAERQQLIEACNTKRCDTLYISPEQLADNSLFAVLSQLRIALLVIEEAHHLSKLGATSDPHYLRIAQLLKVLPENIRVLATTATANRRVTNDIAKKIGASICSKGAVSLSSLHLHKVLLPTTEEKYAWLAQNNTLLTKPSLIYATTVRECERITEWLGHEAAVYHPQLSLRERTALEQQFLTGEVTTLVCTTATTTFFKKDDIATIIHYDRPLSIVTYYQQLTNGGRGIAQAVAIILYDNASKPHVPKPAWQQAQYQAIINCVAAGDGLTTAQIKAQINQPDAIIQESLQHAVIDGLLDKERSTYYRTPKPFIMQQAYTRHVEEARQLEYNGLSYLLQIPACLMQTMAIALDDTSAPPCGKCSYCTQLAPTIDTTAPLALAEVEAFFTNRITTFSGHKKSAITNRPLRQRLTTGIALSLSDEPLGVQILAEKFTDGVFSQRTLQLAASCLAAHCEPTTIIVPIPSTRHPQLVPQFAQQLAEALNVPYVEVFDKRPTTNRQATYLNDVQQEQHIREHLHVTTTADFSDKHVIIVDDIVRSRFTFAIAADYLAPTNPASITAFALVNEDR